MTRFTLFALLMLGLALGTNAQAQSLTEVRTQLHGALPHLDLTTGQLTRFYPTENHEIILKMDEVYVMCATLLGPDGREVPVDYYISQSGGRYGVIRTEIDNRTPLKALMDAGRATRLE